MLDVERRLFNLEQESRKNFTKVEAMEHLLNGNGQPGLVAEVRTFISEQRGMWKAVMAFGVIITILLSILTIRDLVRKAETDPPQMHRSGVNSPQNANAPSD